MHFRNVLIKAAVVASWFSLPFAIIGQASSLVLKHGAYVQAGTSCKDAPFAAMKSWNGVGFADPHSSGCTSRIVAHRGDEYRIITACTALGDGTPNPSGHADEEAIHLTRLSETSFVAWRNAEPKSTYRWCSAQ